MHRIARRRKEEGHPALLFFDGILKADNSYFLLQYGKRERARTWVKDIHKDKRKENKKKER
jgi:hypothetical protein